MQYFVLWGVSLFHYQGEEITLLLTSKCNTKCKHCYISYSGNFEPDVAREIIEIQQGRGFRVDLNGAEILTNLEYLPLFKLTGADTIMSNGLILYNDEDIYRLLQKNGIRNVELSYHFFIHDTISKVPTYVVESVIEELRMRDFNVVLNTVITSQNYKQLPEMCEASVNLGVSKIRFNNFLLQGKALKNRFKSFVLSNNQILEFFDLLYNLRAQYDEKVLYIDRSGLFDCDCGAERKNNFFCPAIREDLTITPDFKIYPCFYLAGMDEHQIGIYDKHEIILFEDKLAKYSNDHCFARTILNKDFI